MRAGNGAGAVMLAHPVPAHAGILSWFLSFLGGRAAREVATVEARSAVSTVGRAEGRIAAATASRTTARSVERVTARVPTSMGSTVAVQQRPSMNVRLGNLTVSASGSSNGSRRILQNTPASAPYYATKSQAGALMAANRNRAHVVVTSPSVKMRVDLNPNGKPHAGIATPHTERLPRNTQATPYIAKPVYQNRGAQGFSPSTVNDFRVVRGALPLPQAVKVSAPPVKVTPPPQRR